MCVTWQNLFPRPCIHAGISKIRVDYGHDHDLLRGRGGRRPLGVYVACLWRRGWPARRFLSWEAKKEEVIRPWDARSLAQSLLHPRSFSLVGGRSTAGGIFL